METFRLIFTTVIWSLLWLMLADFLVVIISMTLVFPNPKLMKVWDCALTREIGEVLISVSDPEPLLLLSLMTWLLWLRGRLAMSTSVISSKPSFFLL